MAGRGPAPKDPSRRARTNRDLVDTTVVPFEPSAQPRLPQYPPLTDDDGDKVRWPAPTLRWWRMWRETPLSDSFTATDWSELLDTAVLHARFWLGDVKVAAELRLRVAKFGATPEDRARLRIQFAAADSAEGQRSRPAQDGRYDGLRAVE